MAKKQTSAAVQNIQNTIEVSIIDRPFGIAAALTRNDQMLEDYNSGDVIKAFQTRFYLSHPGKNPYSDYLTERVLDSFVWGLSATKLSELPLVSGEEEMLKDVWNFACTTYDGYVSWIEKHKKDWELKDACPSVLLLNVDHAVDVAFAKHLKSELAVSGFNAEAAQVRGRSFYMRSKYLTNAIFGISSAALDAATLEVFGKGVKLYSRCTIKMTTTLSER